MPRSGSTLLQRMMATHPAIRSTAEPWLLLPLLYTLRTHGAYTEYGHKLAVSAVREFAAELPGGEQEYIAEMRQFVMRLYARIAGEAPYFLDKTPRYSMIANDVMRLLPDAKYVFLWRNPLSVIASLVETFRGGRWCAYAFTNDLYGGMATMHEAYLAHRHRADRVFAVQYESLLSEPERIMSGLAEFLGLPFDAKMLSDFSAVEFAGRKVDPTGRLLYKALNNEPLDKWKRTLSTPLRKAWCRRYLQWLGEERLATMGYSLQSLMHELQQVPTQWRRTLSDLSRMSYGVMYNGLNLPVLWDRQRSRRAWRHTYAHH